MRLQTEGPPNAADGHAAEPGSFGQTTRAPMGLAARRALQGLNHHPLDVGVAYLTGRPRSRLVVESFQTRLQKSRAPLADHAQRGTCFTRHGLVVKSFGAGQYNACAPRLG